MLSTASTHGHKLGVLFLICALSYNEYRNQISHLFDIEVVEQASKVMSLYSIALDDLCPPIMNRCFQ